MSLFLHVLCSDDNTMDVTSNHLEVVPFPTVDQLSEPGEEMTKRVDTFGHPVGKRDPRFLKPHAKTYIVTLYRWRWRTSCPNCQNPQRAGTEGSVRC